MYIFHSKCDYFQIVLRPAPVWVRLVQVRSRVLAKLELETIRTSLWPLPPWRRLCLTRGTTKCEVWKRKRIVTCLPAPVICLAKHRGLLKFGWGRPYGYVLKEALSHLHVSVLRWGPLRFVWSEPQQHLSRQAWGRLQVFEKDKSCDEVRWGWVEVNLNGVYWRKPWAVCMFLCRWGPIRVWLL